MGKQEAGGGDFGSEGKKRHGSLNSFFCGKEANTVRESLLVDLHWSRGTTLRACDI